MARSARQLKILELIGKKDIETQDELAAELMLAHYKVTQATISRDIKELGLVKVSTIDGKQKYAKEVNQRGGSGKLIELFRQSVIKIDYAQTLIVVKTIQGGAKTCGLMIDKQEFSSVLGCVAGDDTVIVAVKSEKSAAEIVNYLNEILYN